MGKKCYEGVRNIIGGRLYKEDFRPGGERFSETRIQFSEPRIQYRKN